MNIIIISSHHQMPVPQVTVLEDHTLIIANEYCAPDAFALVTPMEDNVSSDQEKTSELPVNIVLDNEEAYRLYTCLHSLFQEMDDKSEDEETRMEQTRIHWLERKAIESGEPCAE
jgi:hypothetical protein